MAIELNASRSQTAAPKQADTLSKALANLTQKSPDVQDRILFTEQLALMLETGMALHEALKAFCTLDIKPGLKTIVESLMNDVEEGRTFSAALSRHADFFSMAYINLVAAAENGGFLDRVLVELKDMDEKREKLKSTVVSAMVYPAFLILFSLGVVVFVLVFVFPKFAELFARISDQLPGSTRILMAASHALINYWWLFIAVITVLAVAGRYWLKTPHGIETMDRLKLSVVVIKDIFVQLYLVQSMRLMAMSMANGVSVMDTLEACREVVRNNVFNRFIAQLQVHVEEGAGFSAGFEEADFMPATVKQMIRTGDDTGNLPQVMARVADYYERELEKKLALFARLVEPIMLLVMGAVVGLIVSSLILPIFKLSRAVA
ncbi:MAG: type II secretion system F family protein [Gammaproteobacteria bacterium]|nr:type II secretion system F family protein [Gammaproteobacteria bacterium]